jgi:hypothetical protein
MIFGFTFTSKRGKGEFCRKKTIGFTLMVTRGKKNSHMRTVETRGSSPLFITCRSERFSTAVETATAVHLSKPVGLPTEISLGGNLEARGDLSDHVDEKGH